jgi:hypothetical protein
MYTVQNLYGHFLYRSKFIQFKIYTVQNLYWLKKAIISLEFNGPIRWTLFTLFLAAW